MGGTIWEEMYGKDDLEGTIMWKDMKEKILKGIYGRDY